MAIKGRYIYEWPRPMVTVDALIFAKTDIGWRVLLIERGGQPYLGKWAVPGGFVEMDEELEAAAVRELAEETGLSGLQLRQMHTFGTVGRDPRGRQITVVFWGVARAEQMNTIKAGDDAAKARWFDIDDLPELAFDHAEIIAMGRGMLDG